MNQDNRKLLEIFVYFLRLGSLGFGGPLAIVAQMQSELVDKKKWLSLNEFNQAFTFIKMMPGPVAFSTAVYIGRHRGGFWGGLLAGIGLIFPAFLLMIVMAIFYDYFTTIPTLLKIFHGMQMAAMVLIFCAFWSLIKQYKKDWLFWSMLAASLILIFTQNPLEPLLILGFGLFSVLFQKKPTGKLNSVSLELFFICFYAGALVFGTGLAIVPMLEKDFVNRLGWLTQSQFLDAIAFGQLTPGPVTITVTFIGYKVVGLWGAVVATVGIFTPSAIHMLTWFPHALRWLKKQNWIESFFKGAIAAIGASILYTCFKLTHQWKAIDQIIVLGLFFISLRFKIPAYFLILIGAVVGFLL